MRSSNCESPLLPVLYVELSINTSKWRYALLSNLSYFSGPTSGSSYGGKSFVFFLLFPRSLPTLLPYWSYSFHLTVSQNPWLILTQRFLRNSLDPLPQSKTSFLLPQLTPNSFPLIFYSSSVKSYVSFSYVMSVLHLVWKFFRPLLPFVPLRYRPPKYSPDPNHSLVTRPPDSLWTFWIHSSSSNSFQGLLYPLLPSLSTLINTHKNERDFSRPLRMDVGVYLQ